MRHRWCNESKEIGAHVCLTPNSGVREDIPGVLLWDSDTAVNEPPACRFIHARTRTSELLDLSPPLCVDRVQPRSVGGRNCSPIFNRYLRPRLLDAAGFPLSEVRVG